MQLQDQASLLPQKPGVYMFVDEKGTVLYVGKAKNLRSRVASYFASTGISSKILRLRNDAFS